MNERALDFIGSVVDEMFLAPGRLIAYVQSRRKINWQEYAKEVEFYHEQGYVDHPLNFFKRPTKVPEFRVATQTGYRDGIYQVISFPSEFEPDNPFVRERYLNYEENKTGYVVRWTHGDKPRRTVLCVHGFMMGAPREAERMFKVGHLYDMGLDVALMIHPFHWKRVAGHRPSRRIYLKLGDAAFTNEAVAQSIYDLENAFHILNALGVSEIGVIGASLGGYISGVYACLSNKPKFVALMVPSFSFLEPISPNMLLRRAPFDSAWRKKVRRAAEFHSPLNMRPQVSVDDVLVVASRGDKLCPFDLTDQLKKRWGLSHCHYRTGGHWLVFDNLRGRAWYDFLHEKGFIAG